MRAVAYKTVLDRVAGLLDGLAGAEANGVLGLDRTAAAVAVGFIQRAAQEFWERYPWPELCVIERRVFRPMWSTGSTWAAGDEVWFWPTRKYYQALRAVGNTDPAPASVVSGLYVTNRTYWAEACSSVTTGAEDWDAATNYAVGDTAISLVNGNVYQAHTAHTNQAPPNGSYWGLRSDFVRSLSLDQTGETPIGMVRKVWDIDPRRCDPQAAGGHELRFDVFNDEVIVRPQAGSGADIVWAQFWTRPPSYSGEAWAAGSSYTAGQQMYFTDGDFYRCVTNASAGESPLTAAAKWERQEFPRILLEMVAWRVFGEMDPKQGDGPMGDGLTMAEDFFAREVVKIDRQQGQARQLTVMTR